MPSPHSALVDEFAAYYTADELPLFIDDHLLEHGDESADRLIHILGPQAPEAAELLRAAAEDPAHPLLGDISAATQFDWNGEPESWSRFQQLAARIADRVDAGDA
jgi:hypothetical protein